MAGKNKIERSFRIEVDDAGGTVRDLSGDLVPGSVSGGGLKFGEVEMTGVSDGIVNFLAGHPESVIGCAFHMNDTATTGASTVLNALQLTANGIGTVTLKFGQAGSAPTTGDMKWSGEYVLLSSNVQPDGGKFVHQCEFKPYGGTAPAWGTI